MVSDTVEQKVQNIIAEQLGIAEDDIGVSSTFRGDLGADSLDFIEVIMAVEEEFELDIPENDAEALGDVGKLTHYVAERVMS